MSTAPAHPTRATDARRRLAAAAGAVALAAGAAVATAAPASAYTGGVIDDRIVESNPTVRMVSASATGTTPYDAWQGSGVVVDAYVAARGYQGCYGFMYSSHVVGYGDWWYGWKTLICPVTPPPATIPPMPPPVPVPDPGADTPPAPQPDPEPEPTRRPGPRPIHTEIPR